MTQGGRPRGMSLLPLEIISVTGKEKMCPQVEELGVGRGEKTGCNSFIKGSLMAYSGIRISQSILFVIWVLINKSSI